MVKLLKRFFYPHQLLIQFNGQKHYFVLFTSIILSVYRLRKYLNGNTNACSWSWRISNLFSCTYTYNTDNISNKKNIMPKQQKKHEQQSSVIASPWCQMPNQKKNLNYNVLLLLHLDENLDLEDSMQNISETFSNFGYLSSILHSC